jgi:hypothetical protein
MRSGGSHVHQRYIEDFVRRHFTDWDAVDRFARELGATVAQPVELAGA